VRAGSLAPAAAAFGAVGALFTLLALLFRVRFAGPALFSLAAEYVLVEVTGRADRFSVIAYAAGLVVLTEVVLWLGQLPSSAFVDVRVVAVWLRNLGCTALAGALFGLVALAATGLRIPSFLVGTLIGCAAAVVLLALPWFLLRRRGGTESRNR
jgi:hypothetical protein